MTVVFAINLHIVPHLSRIYVTDGRLYSKLVFSLNLLNFLKTIVVTTEVKWITSNGCIQCPELPDSSLYDRISVWLCGVINHQSLSSNYQTHPDVPESSSAGELSSIRLIAVGLPTACNCLCRLSKT